MEIKQFNRITFPVNAVQVTLQNIEEVAEWCKGTIEQRPTKMMGTTTDLPVIRLKGQGNNRGQEFEAALGCWVVELKGSFRSYKPAQFDASFEEVVPTYRIVDDVTAEPVDANELNNQALVHFPKDSAVGKLVEAVGNPEVSAG